MANCWSDRPDDRYCHQARVRPSIQPPVLAWINRGLLRYVTGRGRIAANRVKPDGPCLADNMNQFGPKAFGIPASLVEPIRLVEVFASCCGCPFRANARREADRGHLLYCFFGSNWRLEHKHKGRPVQKTRLHRRPDSQGFRHLHNLDRPIWV
jgi:hypothetical protein